MKTKINLLLLFLRALTIDAKQHPEKLRTTKEVWDKEWDKLLKGIDDDS